eukprot:4606031-Karenia_brevis.AAC.1
MVICASRRLCSLRSYVAIRNKPDTDAGVCPFASTWCSQQGEWLGGYCLYVVFAIRWMARQAVSYVFTWVFATGWIHGR